MDVVVTVQVSGPRGRHDMVMSEEAAKAYLGTDEGFSFAESSCCVHLHDCT